MARLAEWLVEKGRPDDAVAMLAAWAASGPSDSDGQQLLAEALRIDPAARVAQQAFERMEGMAGEHPELDAAIARFGAEELARLEAEMRRPSFRRAQMGFNNNIKFREQVFHVQTEDSGLDQPHIITHLFADGGRIIKSHKRSYAGEVARADVAEYVRSLMKAQHLEMVMALREGRFDAVLEGREIGGIELLTEPPKLDNIKRLASKKEQRAEAAAPAIAAAGASLPPAVPAAPAAASEPAGRAQARVYFTLHVLRSLAGGPERYDATEVEAVIGSSGVVALPGEKFCHASEARLEWKDARLWLQDLEGGNGVFLRIRTPVELELGDEFVVGDQLLRIEKNPIADDGPDPAPTYFYSSPKWPSSFRVAQLFEGGAPGATIIARGNTLQIGSAIGDLLFPDDPLVAEQHCVVEEQAGSVVLTDLTSRTGVFVRIRGTQELAHGDELLVGRTRLVVDTSAAPA
ncbi:MAG: FHA domain-containing protein [Sorangiineae bacterium]|nr:FHA domain-containing protein [Polyangiaceae bacterium]MEB2324678.1 FHA domain-containing protein [Sorangiineae bacterium]